MNTSLQSFASGNQCFNLALSQAKRKGLAQQTADKRSFQLFSQSNRV